MAWPVRSAAAQVRCTGGPFAEFGGVATKGALVDLAILGPRKGDTVNVPVHTRPWALRGPNIPWRPYRPASPTLSQCHNMCHCQLSGPILPRLAAIPPWAATVCDRGRENLGHAGGFSRPCSAMPSVARKPAAALRRLQRHHRYVFFDLICRHLVFLRALNRTVGNRQNRSRAKAAQAQQAC